MDWPEFALQVFGANIREHPLFGAKGCGFHPSNNRHVPYQSLTKMPLAEEITQ